MTVFLLRTCNDLLWRFLGLVRCVRDASIDLISLYRIVYDECMDAVRKINSINGKFNVIFAENKNCMEMSSCQKTWKIISATEGKLSVCSDVVINAGLQFVYY